MNKKLTLTIIVMVCLMGIAVAGSFALRDATIPAQDTSKAISPDLMGGTIHFSCGNKPSNITFSVPNGRTDLISSEFLRLIPYSCQEQVTNVIDWNGRRLREVGDFKSFDETEIKTKECEAQSLSLVNDACINPVKVECDKQGLPYDDKTNSCVQKEEPVVDGGLE